MFTKSLLILCCSVGLAGCSAGYAQYGDQQSANGVGYCRSGVYNPDVGGCVHALSPGQLEQASPTMRRDPQCDGRDGYWTNVSGVAIHRTCVYNR